MAVSPVLTEIMLLPLIEALKSADGSLRELLFRINIKRFLRLLQGGASEFRCAATKIRCVCPAELICRLDKARHNYTV
jgi:hypothetical protein